jgi:hypothetical protein
MFSFSKHIFFAATVFAALALTGCTKPTSLGSDLVDGDLIYGELVESDANTTATADFRMNTTTEAEDSIPTFRYSSPVVYMSRFLFGSINDPVFGKYTSGIYLQPYVNSAQPLTEAVADSVFLILQYDMPANSKYPDSASTNTTQINTFKGDNIIGDTLPQQSLTVYQLSDIMDNSLASGYYSDKVFATISTPLATFDYTAHPTSFIKKPIRNWKNTTDSVIQKSLPHLRIKLDKTLADALFSDKTKLANNSDLRNILKGIYIAPSTNNTFLHRFNLLNNKIFSKPVSNTDPIYSASGVLVYYHLPTEPTKALTYRITFDGLAGSSIACTKFTHTKGAAIVNALSVSNKKRIGDSVIYVQGMAGTNGKITFPNLGKLKGKVIINKAELTLKAVSDGTNFPKPLYLGLTQKMTTGFYETISDMSYTSNLVHSYNYLPSPLYGGKLNTSTYTMDITIAMQNLIDGKTSTPDKDLTEKYLYISNLGKLYNAQRVALGGARNRVYAPTLKVYLTRL